MKKINWIFIIFTVMFFISCQSTSFVADENLTVLYDKDIPAACEKSKLFTSIKFSSYYKDPNYIIGSRVESNLTNPKTVEQLPISFKKRRSIIAFNKETNVLEIYKRDEKIYSQYSFTVKINIEQLKNLADLTFEYETAIDKSAYWLKEADDAVNPLIEKTRSVPYTAYRSVSRPVTQYFWDGTPYTTYIYEQEPYTAYRLETYMAPNPKYDPTSVEKYRSYAASYAAEASRAESKINAISFYELYFKD